jgi:uncharacterized delta-60 repeat protein
MKRILLAGYMMCLVAGAGAQTLTQQWATSHAGNGDNSDRFNAVIRDASGNLYAAGFTMRQGDGKDFLLVKFNSTGDTLWTRTYDGPANGNDELEALAFDNAGNIAVTGTSKTATGKDVTTALYNPSGALQWLHAYNHTGNLDDYGVKVATDNSGNIFAAGYGYNAAFNNDYIVIKYSTAGQVLATAVFNGAENLDDELADLAVDGSGNVVVTGQSGTSSKRDDYATVKYNNSLVEHWVKTLDQAGKNDRATGVWIDAAGDVYVTGRSNNGGDYDYVTLKYNGTNGNTNLTGWTQPKIYDSNGDDEPADIAGNANEIVVSGIKFNGVQNDIQTIAYNPSTGAVLWSVAYTNVSGNNEEVAHVTIGPSDAVIVTGTTDVSATTAINDDILVLKYNGAGALQYAKITGGTDGLNDNGLASVLDASGNIYTVGGLANTGTMKDAALLLHDAAGSLQFTKNYNGEGEFTDKVIAICNSGGAIYTTGYVYGYDEDRNYCTIKYDAAGNKLWVKTYNGPDDDTDEPVAIAGDGSGNVYVVGRSKGQNNDYDVLLIKYNANGDTLWTRRWDGGVLGDDEARDMAVDGSGNVYVTGVSDGDASVLINNDFITLKYSASGALAWAVPYNGNGGADDRAYSIALDNNGNAFVAGRTWNGTDYDIQVQKYASGNGAESAFASYTSNLGDDQPSKVRIDNNGNVAVAGTSDRDASAATDRDYLTIQYNSAGVQQWLQLYNGGATGDDDLSDMVVDGSGNVYVTGGSDLDSSATDNVAYVTIKYNNAGVQQWNRNYNGAAGKSDIAYSLAVDATGKVYVTGQADEGTAQNSNNNIVTVMYAADGSELQVLPYAGAADGTDAGSVVLLDNNTLYVAGYATYSTAAQKDMVTIKYATPDGIETLQTVELPVYPNPIVSGGNIVVPGAGNAVVTIYNVAGEKVQTQVVVDTAVINVSQLPAGIYVAERQTTNQRAIAKFVVQ